MSDVFFTSDEHYGHANIIQYSKRPFANTDEMREAMIERHNAVVKKGDLTYHLGDMFWRSLTRHEKLAIRNRLNGQHYYVLGNHEQGVEDDDEVRASFVWVRDAASVQPSKGFPKIWLSHYAHRVWRNSHKGSWHLYGHSHGVLPEYGLSFDVGVDGHDFRPWSFEEVRSKMQFKKDTGVGPTPHHPSKEHTHRPDESAFGCWCDKFGCWCDKSE